MDNKQNNKQIKDITEKMKEIKALQAKKPPRLRASKVLVPSSVQSRDFQEELYNRFGDSLTPSSSASKSKDSTLDLAVSLLKQSNNYTAREMLNYYYFFNGEGEEAIAHYLTQALDNNAFAKVRLGTMFKEGQLKDQPTMVQVLGESFSNQVDYLQSKQSNKSTEKDKTTDKPLYEDDNIVFETPGFAEKNGEITKPVRNKDSLVKRLNQALKAVSTTNFSQKTVEKAAKLLQQPAIVSVYEKFDNGRGHTPATRELVKFGVDKELTHVALKVIQKTDQKDTLKNDTPKDTLEEDVIEEVPSKQQQLLELSSEQSYIDRFLEIDQWLSSIPENVIKNLDKSMNEDEAKEILKEEGFSDLEVSKAIVAVRSIKETNNKILEMEKQVNKLKKEEAKKKTSSEKKSTKKKVAKKKASKKITKKTKKSSTKK